MSIPKGFKFSATGCGIKKDKVLDLGIIVSDYPCTAAGVFTQNLLVAPPVTVSKNHLGRSKNHFAIVCNSGNANAATGKRGMDDAISMAKTVAGSVGCKPDEVFVASTGVIGQFLPISKITKAIPKLVKVSIEYGKVFAEAIMTTDTKPKIDSVSIKVGGKKVTVWGCAKGSGMIHPNMATMLGFIITDANIPKPLLKAMLKDATKGSFNKITIDGDTSTNDSLYLLANSASGAKPLKKGSSDYKIFAKALLEVCTSLSEQMVMDGEGTTRIAEIKVEKAKSEKQAAIIAKSIAGSLLVKTALHGADANWGRVIAAAGYSGVKFNPSKIELYFGKHCAYKKGMPVKGMEAKLTREMKKKKVEMVLRLNNGKASASYLFSDLSKDYISINADYRS